MRSTAKSNLVNENEDAPEYADEGEEEGDDRHVEGGADQPPGHRQASRASVCFMVMQAGFRGYIVNWETQGVLPELSLGDMGGHLHPENDDDDTKGLATFLILEGVQVSKSTVLLSSLRIKALGTMVVEVVEF